ncbi:protein AF-9 isoform X2 [Narcine bancroftii]|uniref:protein AF-9 isoform X2 n=1 Tax=Narcine bancroftii TaxID=1343680 RepID=UPI0038321E65
MAASATAVQVKLELGHRAQVRKKPTIEGFTHDWMVFVRGPEHSNIQHFVEKVVFHLHDSFPRPKRVCKDPPYKVEESGYAGFIMLIEVYFRNKEEPKKVRFDYDLFLHLEGHPPVNHLRCEKLTFNNPTEEFRRKLLKAGGDPNKSSSNSSSKSHKSTKEHKDKPSKDSKEHKSAFKELSREHSKTSKESLKKPKENKPLKDEKTVPKTAFKEPKPMSKEPKPLENSMVSGSGGIQQDVKTLTKRPPIADTEELVAKKKKKSNSDSLFKSFSSACPQPPFSEKKLHKDRPQVKPTKIRMESEVLEKKKPSLPPFEEIVDPNDSAAGDEASSKSESQQPSPAGSSSSSNSSSSFTPSQNNRQGPLRSIMEDLHSEDNESDEDENGNLSDVERSLNTHCGSRGHRKDMEAKERVQRKFTRMLPGMEARSTELFSLDQRRMRGDLIEVYKIMKGKDRVDSHCLFSKGMSLSDGSDSENSGNSTPPRNEAPPILKASNINNQAYLDELVELHRRLMTLRERHILQQIVNLIEETGHFHITNTTFDFDLCSLDKTTVRKLQSYLETSGAS